MNDVVFIKGQGGLGRPLTGEDHISGMVFYDGTLPSGFSSTDRIKEVFQISDAEALGITNTYSDETKATASYLVTTAGATGDVAVIKVAEPSSVVTIGTYTKPSTDTTAALVATGIAAAINAGTATHGYTATVATATVTITARTGLGIFLNSGTPLTVTVTGTIAGTVTQFSGGVASKLAIYHYHIAEYFRIQPKGVLYVGFFAVPSTFDGTEVDTMQRFTSGLLRQCAVYYTAVAYSSAQITALQTVANGLESDHMPLSILYAPDISGTANVSSLTTLQGLNSPKVSLVIGQDGAAVGFNTFKAVGKSISNLGAALGAVSLAAVDEDIAWTGKFNLTDGTELDTPAFSNGQLVRSVSTALLNQLNSYKYIFVKKFIGNTGTFFNDSHTCTVSTSDYCFIENNRAIDKAIRNLYIGYLPLLNSPLVLNADGTLSDNTVANFETVGDTALDQMVRDSELSAKDIIVDPSQDVLSTSIIYVTAKLVPIGVARQIIVKIGYVKSV